jgi:serine/threonine-protein kinase
MVRDLLRGEAFAARLAREGPLPLAEVAGVMLHVASATAAAHAAGVVHRDLKPDNIFLVDEPGGGKSVKVLDFGIAKLAELSEESGQRVSVTGGGGVMGTPFYMAPEQLFGDKALDHRADLWAIGVILYEALSGVRPVEGENLGEVFRIVAERRIVPIAERMAASPLPEPITALVTRLLTYDRAARPELSEVASVLASYAEGTTVRPAPSDPRMAAAWTPHRVGVQSEDAFAPTMALAPSSPELVAPPRPPDAAVARPKRAGRAILAGVALALVLGVGLVAVRRSTASATAEESPRRGVAMTDHPLPESTKPEAQVHYASALSRIRIGGVQSQVELLKAVGLDPTLAAAELRVALYGVRYRLPANDRRTAFLRAMDLQPRLEPRDQALLPIARAVATDRPDYGAAIDGLAVLEAKSPLDAELPLLRAIYGYMAGREDVWLSARQRVVALDPMATQVDNLEGKRLLRAGDSKGARAVAERCLAASPEASLCRMVIAQADGLEGNCAGLLADALELVQQEPDLGISQELRANALAAAHASVADVHAALVEEQKRSAHRPDLPEGFPEIETALLQGDLAAADRAAEEAAAKLPLSSSERDHVPLTMVRIELAEEMGDRAAALALADAFEEQASAWVPDAPGGVRLKGAYLRHEAGLVDDAGLERTRARLEEETRRALSGFERALDNDESFWSQSVRYTETAGEARAAFARDAGAEGQRARAVDLGRAMWLAGRLDDAARVLWREAATCDVLTRPGFSDLTGTLDFLHSRLYLGLVLEAKGDRAGACQAFRVIEDRWRVATPRSVTLDKARERSQALGCPR